MGSTNVTQDHSLRLLALMSVVALSWSVIFGLIAPSLAADGKWSPANPTTPPTSFQQIHMTLLPGDGSQHHSRIVTWEGSGATKGAELGWNVGADGCTNAPYTLPVIGSWDPGAKIFCSGHSHLLAGTSSELLTVGGHAFGHGVEVGNPDSRTFAPGTGSDPGVWTGPPARPEMQQARFYSSVTTLADGRAIVTGGQGAAQAWFFGGRVSGNPPATGTGNRLHRYDRGGGWDFAVTPKVTVEGEFPRPREGHSAVYLAHVSPDPSATVYFGGRDSTGNPINELGAVWLLRREDGTTLDADYTYRWTKRSPAADSPRPVARSEHTAVRVSDTEMIVFGGTQTAGEGFWRFYRDEFGAWRWETVTATSGTAPTARYGHTAVYQGNPSRMIVFGGSDTPGGTAADNGVYAFNFSGGVFSSGTWSTIGVAAGPGPDARRDHIMVYHPSSASVFVHGGHLGGGASSDTLWQLNLSTPAWGPIATSGPSPGPRANHAAFFDAPFDERLYIFGGEPAPSAEVDKFTYYIEPLTASGPAIWVKGGEAADKISGHTAEQDGTGGPLHARRSEIYNRGTNTWTTQSNSGWLPSYGLVEYPVQFVVPGSNHVGGGGRLVRVGADPIPRYLDVPVSGLSSGWSEVRKDSPPVALSSVPPLKPYTGVMYEPGKILVVGSRVDPSNAAKTLDATAIGSSDWVAQPDGARGSELNLVILPNGQVLALGGYAPIDTPVRCPQLWTPGIGTLPGTWTTVGSGQGGCDGCALDCDLVVRNYHSTAMLLPDGRVLTGGGTSTGDETKLSVFCPPYLDSAAEWTGRPVITSAPSSITYGEAFVIGKQSSDSISSACLIRPAATTHGFDQNQRYVPLTLVWETADTLRALAPGNGSIAPPGHYLLFTVNKDGVPAVAKWIRLANCPTVPCDNEPPPVVSDLYADVVTPNEIWLAWSAPGDDRNPALGAYDMRISTSPITSERTFSTAAQVVGSFAPPAPGSLGSGQSCAKLDLTPNTLYHFALKTHDGATNWSTKATLSVSTIGNGGGLSAVPVDERAEGVQLTGDGSAASALGLDHPATDMSSGGASAAPAGTMSLEPTTGSLVAETRRATSGGWEVTLRRVSEPEGLDPALAEVIVSQVRAARGGWKTLGRHQPSAEQGPLGLCALRDQGRVVFPVGYTLDRVVSGLREGSQELSLSFASHSRLGSLGEPFLDGGGSVEMALGDAVTLTYAPGTSALPGAASWYLLVRTGGASEAGTLARRDLSSRIPTRFALHQNQPNPSRGTTSISFDLPVASPVTLEVFDLLGRKVATLAEGVHAQGSHSVEWNLRDTSGGRVRSGVYVYRLVAGAFRAKSKMGVLP